MRRDNIFKTVSNCGMLNFKYIVAAALFIFLITAAAIVFPLRPAAAAVNGGSILYQKFSRLDNYMDITASSLAATMEAEIKKGSPTAETYVLL
ncbi:MAG TPA: hypothetical protein PKL57_13375, partial [Candidatus Wallbacteria bacterium]|nr:hypothetical protein [Candidatus Wallbacteria bacterium]